MVRAGLDEGANLNGDQGLGHPKSGSKEDANDFADVGRDQVADELCGQMEGREDVDEGSLGGKSSQV